MRFERLDRGEHVYAVSGLGAARILASESGLHVLEVPDVSRDDLRAERVHALVQVVASRSEAGPDGALAEHARAALDAARMPAEIVRRYRVDPAPLVRDVVRGYRTGRLDRVLAGDFDLF